MSRRAATAALLALAPLAVLAAEPGALRDPTLPPAASAPLRADAAAPEASAPVLKMIVRQGNARRALLDGSYATVGVGDWIDAPAGRVRVLEIDDHGLLLARADGARQRIDLADGGVQRRAHKTSQDAAASSAARSGR